MTNLNYIFEAGKNYEMAFIGDSELKPVFTCVKRTSKTATFKSINSSQVLTRKIKESDGAEYVLEGSYSMAPSINAKRKV